jgi:hypothetical protein
VGKVYWVQASWTLTDGSRHWDSARVHTMRNAPMERTAVALQWRPPAASRRVTVSSTNRLLAGSDDDSEIVSLSTQVVLDEKVTTAGNAMTFTLGYQSAKQTLGRAGREVVNMDPPAEIRRAFPLMKALFRLDAAGLLTQNALAPITAVRLRSVGLADKKPLDKFHDSIKEWMAPLMLHVPSKTLQPRDTWKLRRSLGWQASPRSPTVRVDLDLACRYLGVRGAAGEQEAVIGIEGAINDRRHTGKVRGLMTVSVAGGAIKNVELDVEMDVPEVLVRTPDGQMQKLKVRSIQALRLNRGL